MRFRMAFALACVPAVLGVVTAPAHATVWKRMRADGTAEFTNVPARGNGWSAVKETRRAPSGPSAARTTSSTGSAVWTRARQDGSLVEFTNITPVGSRWKVLFRTGPGKAAAVRGDSDKVPPRDGSPARYARYDEHIRDQQAFYGIPQALMRAVIRTESDFDPNVVSSVGAQGLMQLMPGTAKQMGVTDVWDPRQNIMGGARYLQLLAKRFCKTPATTPADRTAALVCSLDEKMKVLAGYHAGPGAVLKYGGMPPYETTRFYVTTVLRRYEEYRQKESAAEWVVAAR